MPVVDVVAGQACAEPAAAFDHGLVVDADRVADAADRIQRAVPGDPDLALALPATRQQHEERIWRRVDHGGRDLDVGAAALGPSDDRVAETRSTARHSSHRATPWGAEHS